MYLYIRQNEKPWALLENVLTGRIFPPHCSIGALWRSTECFSCLFWILPIYHVVFYELVLFFFFFLSQSSNKELVIGNSQRDHRYRLMKRSQDRSMVQLLMTSLRTYSSSILQVSLPLWWWKSALWIAGSYDTWLLIDSAGHMAT